MKNKNQFRQGDVLIERVESVPQGAVKSKGRVILAEGEATGHAHEINIDDADAWKRDGQTIAVTVKKSSAVKHQEHGPIPLKLGNYRVTRQREYSPEENPRNVAD